VGIRAVPVGAKPERASVRSGSVSAAQLSDGAQNSFTCARVVLNERVRAEDGRNFCSVAVLLD